MQANVRGFNHTLQKVASSITLLDIGSVSKVPLDFEKVYSQKKHF